MAMTKPFDIVCLFGVSGHFPAIIDCCQKLGIDVCLIYGPRQSSTIDSLNISGSIRKLCITSLLDPSYLDLEINLNNALGLSFGSPFIFKDNDIKAFNGNLINSHGTPLPKYKGGAPVSWRIMQRDRAGSIIMHQISKKIDEGKCLFRHDFIFDRNERLPHDYECRQRHEEQLFLLPWLEKILKCEIDVHNVLVPQCKSKVISPSYYPRISNDLHGFINWCWDVYELEAFILAFANPYLGAITYLKGKKVRIANCAVVEMDICVHPFSFGIIIDRDEDSITVACKGGALRILLNDIVFELQPVSIGLGDRFFTPYECLSRALATRVFFKPDGASAREYHSWFANSNDVDK